MAPMTLKVAAILRPGHEVRQRMGHADLEQDVGRAGADRAHQRQQARGRPTSMPASIDSVTGKEGDDHDQQDLRREPVAEPEDEDRRQRHLRHVLEQHDQRIERAAQPVEAHDEQREGDADHGRGQEADEDLARRHAALASHSDGHSRTSALRDRGGRRHDEGETWQISHHGFPQQQRHAAEG